MAQLKDTIINGNLDVGGVINVQTGKDYGIFGLHPNTGGMSSLIYMSPKGNTVVGYDNYINSNGNALLCGTDVSLYLASTGTAGFRPYRRAGDSINFAVNTTGYVTSSGQNVVFTIPLAIPILGSPTAIATSDNGFILRQNGYTHGSDWDDSSNSYIYAKPTSYSVTVRAYIGFVITATFDVTTNVTNNSPIGIYWDGTITLS